MSWECIKSLPVNFDVNGFWSALDLWNRIPHVVNRRICGVENIYRDYIENDLQGIKLKAALEEAKSLMLRTENCDDGACRKILEVVGLSLPYCSPNGTQGIEVILKKLIPKNDDFYKPCVEIEILDHVKAEAMYTALFYSECEHILTPCIPYRLAMRQSYIISEPSVIELSVCKVSLFGAQEDEKSKLTIDKSIGWLQTNLLPKICKWASTPSNSSMGSLNLIPVNRYNALYNSLKAKYAPTLIKIWPESTDPKKFIHEDLGIAAYLILLWEQERIECSLEKKQSFVDIGCGNGLLVYILSEEGHPGLGVDVRSRQIWNLYPPTTNLQVCSVNPSLEIQFPLSDWLIGNHSDELTPWIPVMAAMNHGSRFFVLPCCPHDFYGKYGRKNPKKSVYQEYLEYIQKEVCEKICEFSCLRDRLRIPSTKRVCIIGKSRYKVKNDLLPNCISPSTYLEVYLGYKHTNITENSFIPRSATEKVRNCTQLEKGVVDEVVSLVAAELLAEVRKGSKQKGHWNSGKKVPLEVLAKLIPSHLLLKMKNESGGLQTLLRNNHFIFKVTGGMVEFRKPVVVERKTVRVKNKVDKSHWKLKRCWFHYNHPDGCPLNDSQCSYLHTT